MLKVTSPSQMLRPAACMTLRSGSRCRAASQRHLCMATAGSETAPDSLTITRPDDWHLHVRDGAGLTSVVPHTAATFGRAIIMPNLQPPVTSVAQALDYRERVTAAIPDGSAFRPLMTLYLTDSTPPEEVRAAKDAGVVAFKLYPAGATTNSASGVTDIQRVIPTLCAMAEEGMLLLVHGEVTDPDVDFFDREAVFIDRHLAPLLDKVPGLKVVMEHITTADAVKFVRSGPAGRLAASITPQHILLNRNSLFQGGLRPHAYCLPILKRERHRAAVLGAAVSGDSRFFLGTDSAPHPKGAKESACGCAGIYSAPVALPLYAHAFEQEGALQHFEAFASHSGPDFYGLPRNEDTVTLVRRPWQVPATYQFGDTEVVPLWAGQTLQWQLQCNHL